MTRPILRAYGGRILACVPLCCDVSSAAAPSAPSPAAAVPRRVLLVGGTSEIGLAIVRRLSAGGPVRPYLLGRDRLRLRRSTGYCREGRWPARAPDSGRMFGERINCN